jgi:hypothetical protein
METPVADGSNIHNGLTKPMVASSGRMVVFYHTPSAAAPIGDAGGLFVGHNNCVFGTESTHSRHFTTEQ